MARTKHRQRQGSVARHGWWAMRPRWLLALLSGIGVLVVVAIVALGYAGSHGSARQRATADTSQPVTASGAVSAGKLSVPDFTVNTASFLGGQRFVLSQQAEKPTLVYFMASWCITCVPEARAIAQLQKGETGQQVNFVVLDIDPSDTERGLESFWKAVNSPNNVWALNKESKVTSAYGVKSLDTTIVIAGGQEASRTVGPRSATQLMDVLNKALGNGS